MEWIVIFIVGVILICPEKAEDLGKLTAKVLKGIKDIKSEKEEIIEPIREIKTEIKSSLKE